MFDLHSPFTPKAELFVGGADDIHISSLMVAEDTGGNVFMTTDESPAVMRLWDLRAKACVRTMNEGKPINGLDCWDMDAMAKTAVSISDVGKSCQPSSWAMDVWDIGSGRRRPVDLSNRIGSSSSRKASGPSAAGRHRSSLKSIFLNGAGDSLIAQGQDRTLSAYSLVSATEGTPSLSSSIAAPLLVPFLTSGELFGPPPSSMVDMNCLHINFSRDFSKGAVTCFDHDKDILVMRLWVL